MWCSVDLMDTSCRRQEGGSKKGCWSMRSLRAAGRVLPPAVPESAGCNLTSNSRRLRSQLKPRSGRRERPVDGHASSPRCAGTRGRSTKRVAVAACVDRPSVLAPARFLYGPTKRAARGAGRCQAICHQCHQSPLGLHKLPIRTPASNCVLYTRVHSDTGDSGDKPDNKAHILSPVSMINW
jgi:hypothetical protein